MAKQTLTTSHGMPVSDDQNTLTAGKKGPALMQDIHLMDKLAHFDRERIPERVVHAKGAGAYGFFEVTHDLSKYTRAKFLSKVGKRTDVFLRFSTVGGEKGSADADRDPRGFAVKFYTEEGNYDMVGNNTPVFFIRDPLKFPDFIHTQKRNPASNLKDPDMFWDFLSLTPESLHQVTVLFSDRGTPKTYRHMNGYTGHTFMFYNEQGEYVWTKLHFKTDQKIQNLTAGESVRLAGEDPDHATRDLYESIETNDYPSWTVYAQIMTQEQVDNYRFDSFDITKVWFHADAPLQPLGKLVLDRNPVNYFTEVEQAAFSPGNFVPGIGPSPDKMLQGRLFSYHDTHRHRLGPNYHLLAVNSPKGAAENSYQRDGFMQSVSEAGPNYYPNTFGGPQPDPGVAAPPVDISGMADRHAYVLSDDDFIQPGELYRKAMNHQDRDHLIKNIVGHLRNARRRLQLRQTALFYKADKEYGERVARDLKLDMEEIKRLAAMSQEDRVNATLE